MSDDDRRPFAPVLLLHDAKTCERVGVNGFWLGTFKPAPKSGTVIMLVSGETVTVQESVDQIAEAFRQ